MGPLLTQEIALALQHARYKGESALACSLDLGRSRATVSLKAACWAVDDSCYPYPEHLKARTIYFWDGEHFQPVARYAGSLIKLVPTEWGPPTFEIDGIKMLPTAKVSPYADAQRKVGLIEPRGKSILDCCGGLGYFAAWSLQGGAERVISFEKNPDVVWLRSLNPWSPEGGGIADTRLALTLGSVADHIAGLAAASVDAILHDPPRFGIAGELYSQAFYDELARVIRPNGRLFHYTGTPNKLTSGRDLPSEVATRLQRAGFTTEMNGDGVLAVKKGRSPARMGKQGGSAGRHRSR